MRALLIANEGDDDPGFVGERLAEHGYAFSPCRREKPGEWPDLAGHDLVLLLGSEWSVYSPHVAESVGAESAVITAACRTGIPILGICFGAQALVHALGGSVARAAQPEIGWHEIESDVPHGIAAGPWMQWHDDAVTLPPAARELARSAICPQAFTLERVLAVQFHPEVTPAVLTRWAAGSADQLRAAGIEPDEFVASATAMTERSAPHARRLVDWFLSTCAA